MATRSWVEGAAEPLWRRRLLLHPSRWPVAVGLAMVARGIFAPWQTMAYPVGPPQITTGVSGADAPGFQILILAAATTLVCALPVVAGSRTRTVQLLPVLAGAATLLVAIQSYQAVRRRVPGIRAAAAESSSSGGCGSFLPAAR